VLVADAVSKLLEVEPNAKITHRDLGESPPPHLIVETINGVRGTAATENEFAARRLSDEFIGELKAADTVVIGAPMYNFSVPTTLRAWFDHVLRPGATFSYADGAPRGLLGGKRVIVIESRGGLYTDGPAKAFDFQEPYLRQLLGFMGITDVTFVHAEKIGYGPEARTASIEAAKAKISEVVERELVEAA
jgi:FMN-dependent NADH-azoreductase